MLSTSTYSAKALDVRGDFVLLRTDTVRMVLPQQDVSDSQYLETAPVLTQDPGVFELPNPANTSSGRHEGRAASVIALSDNMQPLTVFPQGRFVLTRLLGAQSLLLAWSEVRVMINATIQVRPLPPILSRADGLFDSYVVLDDGDLAFCTTAQHLLAQSHIAQWLIRQQALSPTTAPMLAPKTKAYEGIPDFDLSGVH